MTKKGGNGRNLDNIRKKEKSEKTGKAQEILPKHRKGWKGGNLATIRK